VFAPGARREDPDAALRPRGEGERLKAFGEDRQTVEENHTLLGVAPVGDVDRRQRGPVGDARDLRRLEPAVAEEPLFEMHAGQRHRETRAATVGEMQRDRHRRRAGIGRVAVVVAVDPAGHGVKRAGHRHRCRRQQGNARLGAGRAVGELGDAVAEEQHLVRPFEARLGVVCFDTPSRHPGERDQRRMVIVQASGPHPFIRRRTRTLYT
jgi:hypothetical protein